jgi:hypothetical protein
MSAAALALAIFVIILHESNPEEKIQIANLWQQYRLTKAIITNPNLRDLSLIMLTQRIGFGVLESVAPIFLIKSGMPRETLSRIGICNFLAGMLLPILVGRFLSGRNLETLTSVVMTKLLTGVIALFFLSSFYFQKNPTSTSAILLIAFALLLFEYNTIIYLFYIESSGKSTSSSTLLSAP